MRNRAEVGSNGILGWIRSSEEALGIVPTLLLQYKIRFEMEDFSPGRFDKRKKLSNYIQVCYLRQELFTLHCAQIVK